MRLRLIVKGKAIKIGMVLCLMLFFNNVKHFIVSECFAHPHIFIDTKLNFVFDGKGLAGIVEEWTFDNMTGAMTFEDFDKNKNGKFEPAEVAKVKKEAFDALKEFGYFNQIVIDGKKFTVKFIENFKVFSRKGKLLYSFFVPCHVTATKANKKISVSLSDPTIFTDFVLVKGTPSYSGQRGRYAISSKRSGGLQSSGEFIPETITMKFRLK
jgi:ABC-type uncharacterized transport system substrate-binding protein